MPIVEIKIGSNLTMPLPQGWREFPAPDQGAALYTVREFRPENSSDDSTSISYYNRGLALSDYDAQAFSSALRKPEHELSADEIRNLSEILADAANEDTFSTKTVTLKNLNGRMAIVLEGQFYESKTKMCRVYLSKGAEALFVDEVFFSAPSADYDRCIDEVKDCILALK